MVARSTFAASILLQRRHHVRRWRFGDHMPRKQREIAANIGLDKLYLDQLNPRLPAGMQTKKEDELLRYIADRYNTIDVATSIARHGYFISEPMIVIKRKQANGYTVVEGNRRLVALRILSDPTLAEGLEDQEEWVALASQAQTPEVLPVVKAIDRNRVAAVIGFRHISEIEEWEPYAKARFIATLIDIQEMSFEGVADLIGETVADIRSQYRNCGIIEQAQEFGIATQFAEAAFGVFTRAMTSTGIRGHIGASAPARVELRNWPLADDKKRRAKGSLLIPVR